MEQVLKILLEFATHILLQRRRYVTLVGPLIVVEPLTITSIVFITLKNYCINTTQLFNYV